jgi:hypothetical protein
MTTGAITARWELTLRPPTTSQRSPGQYENRPPNRSRLPGQIPGPVALTGEFLLANANCAGPWANIADILIVPTPPHSHHQAAPSHWLADALARHPGCAVAVTGGPLWCTAALRDGTMIRQGTTRDADPLAPARPPDMAVHGIPASLTVPGCLVHALLVARRPLTLLSWAQPLMSAPGPPGTWTTCGQAAGAPFSFGIVFEDPETGRSLSSRARTSTASGAPMAV